MIVGSLLLILVAVTLLVLGLAKGSSGLLISSIAASLLAAVALVVGTRLAAVARAGAVFVPAQGTRARASAEAPPDEPAAQQVPAADAAQVARIVTDVLVIDGRPRYHLPDCAHLRGRESESLPVRDAVELGFTPCGRCEPDTTLLANAQQG